MQSRKESTLEQEFGQKMFPRILSVWCFFVFLLCYLFHMEYVLLATVKRESRFKLFKKVALEMNIESL